ncbi:MAG TPA: hypothetical protein VG267_00385 [Terracidiphilus sp.]|jgi:hypothetical protein|nr:hypothetical protein [Terracidiphilus sp.]
MGTTLIVKGTLRGMGCKAECSLIATRNNSLNGEAGAYTKCMVLDAPLWLPDGYYEVIFCGQSAFLHRVNRTWGVGIPWREDPARTAVTDVRDAMTRGAMHSRDPFND